MAVERCFSSGCAAELPLMRGVKVTWMRYGNAVQCKRDTEIVRSGGGVAARRSGHGGRCEVVALLGDNGAGKSTFVRLLSGAGRPDGGTFRFGGNPVDLAKYSVRKARDMGIETVHQDRCLCEGQSLWRNMFVGRHVRTRWGFIDIAAEREATRVMLGEWLGLGGAGLDPDADVRVLSGGERQALAIGRAMYFGARLVILDEPITALSLKEVKRVLEFIQALRDKGRSVLLVSHHVHQAYDVADRFLFMDKGRTVGEVRREGTSPADLTERLLSLAEGRGA
ncbi:ATP-binding cassette domain-containing protein [Bilophila wadsworthia]|uniref:ATP-binding cassette domain-containing protein n=1 Tax=Bilophila wadsworthia TaxID=35833 RepID=UPI00399D20C1